MELFTQELLWVRDIDPHRIALTSCPPDADSLPAQIEGWKAAGVDVVVSLQEPREREARGISAEPIHCERVGLSFRSFPIRDHDVPTSMEDFAAFTRDIHREVLAGRALVVHCLAGIGRSGLLTASLLFLMGVPRESIPEILRQSRGFSMPQTPEQRQWLEAFYEVLANSR